MSQPTLWSRITNFVAYALANPTATYNPALLDSEFDAAQLTSKETRANLGLIQRDDGLLRNGSVHPNALSAASRLLISGWEILGDWVTATSYEVKDFVENSGVGYVCIAAHVSGASFLVDLAAGKWMQVDINMDGAVQVVATIAALKARNSPTNPVAVLVLGYAAAGDGGGGLYWWNSADVAADNTGTIIQLNAGGAGRFNKLF